MRAILTYHSLDDTGSVISLAPDRFREHVEWLAEGGVPVKSLERLVAEPDQPGIALTFDDGFENFASVAWPLLKERGLPATLFVVTDQVGRDNRWGGATTSGIPVLPLLDWDSLGRLQSDGLSVGAHTRRHARLTALSDAELTDDWAGAADVIAERLGYRPDSLAYPFGVVDDRVAQAAATHYALACTTAYRPLRRTDDRTRLPRLDAWYFRVGGTLESWGSPSFLLALKTRGLARAIKRFVKAD